MNVRRYQPSDLAMVNGWAVARGLHPVEADAVPGTGFIVPDVLAGWLMLTDTNAGIIDGFISNPAASKEDRVVAGQHVGAMLVGAFRGKSLRVYTAHDGIARWCRENGFEAVGSKQVLIREF